MNQHMEKVATEVIVGLKQQPMLLGLVILNLIGIGAATWFLHSLLSESSARMTYMLKACLPGVQP